ncbi:signal recognition particle-docking protein FtsY [Sporomusa sphaeroides]|uniref:Signal recognition particle receptor FtsY n=2 Tax=Sporomusa TaxID=2375 RepID=A0ABP2C5N8_9FIRM|nr:signal recognition particle-docking protein FtsY [Sporomusa sphaeroides]OLS58118.1 signal recognition particle receptor FtsY [Sporomusa sphaeroides DSM 2875]CVK17695.1 Signal recognition particle receptor FtsY [Sporomusa sphaeroides DSM 2875]SCM80503.1 Signal recognition particle receptor FtsY [uncultured Sporomusa sp.]
MGFFDKLKAGLEKTRKSFTEKIEQLVIGYATIDDEFLDDLEAVLLSADVGVATTSKLMAEIRKGIKDKLINSPDDLKPFLQEKISAMLVGQSPAEAAHNPPTVILVVGVNGVGKTTTIGKLASYYCENGKKVLLAAGDTFRAAAIDQIEIWGQRTGTEVIKHAEGSDPAAVAFDAVQAAKARKADMVIIDTAGRLHTKSNLMEELKKINRVIAKEIADAPHETLLVLDATTGQNAINQAKLFGDAVKLSGVVLTKLDGTAKGGVVIAINNELDLPVKWVGVGEGVNDLRPFVAADFAAALFADK